MARRKFKATMSFILAFMLLLSPISPNIAMATSIDASVVEDIREESIDNPEIVSEEIQILK